MEKIRLGKTEMMVSKLGFGSIPIQRTSDDEAIVVIKRCLELGINFIDTANGYTTSEGRIGRAISGRREGLILATKSLSRTKEGVASHLQQSLKQLGVDYIDLFQFHDVSDAKSLEVLLAPNGLLTVAEEVKRAGVVKHIGVTSHNMDTAKELVKSERFETIMFPFNFITCEPADELLPMARERDMGFIAMKPLAGGMLDNATIAFKYLLQFPDVVPLLGVEKMHEIEEVVPLVERPQALTTAEWREIERLRQELGKVFCRRCDYCQPCTEEIPISMVMIFPTIVKRLPPERALSGRWAEAMEKAANCTQCGECETRCPYGLPIREKMEEYVNFYQAERRKYQEQAASR